MTSSPARSRMNSSSANLLRLIAVFKLIKASLLIVAGISVLKLAHTDVAWQLGHWATRLGLHPGSRFINYAIERVMNLPPQRIREFGAGIFVYAGLFMTEGIGLWLLKRWAEWFTVIATGSLVPIEAYECYRHLSAIKVLILLINIAVVVYLVYHVRHETAAEQH